MVEPLRTLIVSGDRPIADALCRTLLAAGFGGEHRAVADLDELAAALGPDVELVVCAGRDGAPAADVVVPAVRRADDDVPVLIVGGGVPPGGDPVGVVRVGPREAPGSLQALVRRELAATVSRRTARAAAHAVHVRERALDVATSGVMVADARQDHMPIVYVNRAFERLFGYGRDELIGADPELLAGETTEREARRELAHALRAGRPHQATMSVHRRDGSSLRAEVTLTPAHDPDGTLVEWIAVVDDVTAQVEALDRLTGAQEREGALLAEMEGALHDERHRAQRYLDMAGAVIVVLDPEERVELLNRAGHELLGYDEGELAGTNWFDAVVPEDQRTAARTALQELYDGAGDDVAHENELVTRDGETRVIAWRHTALRDADGRITATMSSGVDLTERRAAEQQIAYLAYHDSLTGLPNRALLQEHLELAMARARRQNTGVALLYLDLDGFKLVNDSLGHPAGDELLCHVTLRLSQRRRDADLLARQGGDEFLLLLADLDRATAEQTAKRVADGLLRALAKPFQISGAEFHIGASIGISLFPRDAADGDQLLRHADASMYEAKANGRNAVSIYSGDPHEPLERLSMTSRLRKALVRGEFVLHWQPIVDPADGRLVKAEALIRWQDPFRGLVLPGEFISFAEETGFVDRVGDWVLREVCDQIHAWEQAGFVPPRVTLNVSPRQLRRPDFGERLLRAVGEEGIAELLTVEITESAAMSDPKRTDPVLRDLAGSGVEIAVDDFGAGYSSLTRLRTMPVQVLKIDRTFLQGVPDDPEATAIVTAIIELAAALGMEAVAEGVESEAQRRFLVQRGCPLAQGFLLGRPVPARELERHLERAPSLRGAQDAP